MKLLLFTLALLFPLLCSAQYQNERRDWVWPLGYDYFGDSIGIDAVTFDFRGVSNGDTMKITYGLQDFEMNATNAALCDSLGNLLVYMNGCAFGNKLRKKMRAQYPINFTTTHFLSCFEDLGLSGAHTQLLLPDNYTFNKYHLISMPLTYLPLEGTFRGDTLMYNRFGIQSIDSINLTVRERVLSFANVKSTQDTSLLLLHLSACLHGNGKDWWVIHPFNGSSVYNRYLVSRDTVKLIGKQPIAWSKFTGFDNASGSSVFSPDGTKFVTYSIVSDVQIFDFDRCTGLLSNLVHIPIQDSSDIYWGAGAAISENSRYLYIPSTYHVYQFDLWAANIEASKVTVAEWDGNITDPNYPMLFNQAQLAPDGKIYMTSPGGRSNFHVIEYPDSAGLACKVVQRKHMLRTAIASGLPNFPYFRLGKWVGSPCDTITSASQEPTHLHLASIRLRPNPATTYTIADIHLLDPNSETALSLSVSDMSGVEIATYQIPAYAALQRIETSTLPNGMYFVALKSRGRVLKTEKLVVLRE
jgi:Secretion system C-terminal sorting domain